MVGPIVRHQQTAFIAIKYASICLFILIKELKKAADGGAKNSGREVLVPNTCELDTSQSSSITTSTGFYSLKTPERGKIYIKKSHIDIFTKYKTRTVVCRISD